MGMNSWDVDLLSKSIEIFINFLSCESGFANYIRFSISMANKENNR